MASRTPPILEENAGPGQFIPQNTMYEYIFVAAHLPPHPAILPPSSLSLSLSLSLKRMVARAARATSVLLPPPGAFGDSKSRLTKEVSGGTLPILRGAFLPTTQTQECSENKGLSPSNSVNLASSRAQECLGNRWISPSNSVNLTSAQAQECLGNHWISPSNSLNLASSQA